MGLLVTTTAMKIMSNDCMAPACNVSKSKRGGEILLNMKGSISRLVWFLVELSIGLISRTQRFLICLLWDDKRTGF